ncbi:MAG TPA: methylated-DNA--[protein]-cysteine S-methyltransferase [Nevskiaceae bacterium]|nr:methylated-DNA--[protein]-cysteine S-methyltransferase [Nevskiaceae bacterium]
MSGEIFYSVMPSPIGELTLVSEGGKLTGLYMESYKHGRARERHWVRDDAKLADARRQLQDYFAGKRTQFDLEMEPAGTAFQKRVWRALCDIPHGETISYGELARRIGQPTASRAVGLANGQNPIAVIVPCHRVIGANGSLTGYGGGLPRKQWLLAHERGQTGGDLFQ